MKARATLLGALALAGCATPPPDRTAGLVPGARYVAMGSSFAAGAGIGPTKEGTPPRCGRTANNYPTLLAAKLGLALVDQTCGGAKTEHVIGPWNELAPQIGAVDARTRLVTLTIGGNDLNYVGNLFMAGCDPAKPFVVQGHVLPCGGMKLPAEADYARLESALRAIAGQVKIRAPGARLVFVQYVTLVPAGPCPAAAMTARNAAQMRELGRRLAAITAKVARDSDAMLLPMDTLSRGHTPCDAKPWAIALPTDRDTAKGAPWHPNAEGHAAVAAALANLLRR